MEIKLPKSYEVIGSREKALIIIEIPDKLKKKEKVIAKKLLKLHKNVKGILKKESERKNAFRLRKFKLLAGDKNTEVVHKESGCLFKLDPTKVYFSPRESTERERISKLVKPNETVLVMFGGVAPYPIVIAKKQPKIKKIYSIELNPDAHKYALENIKLNKIENKIILIKGDVRKECKKLGIKFDRVIMPLPKGAHLFLELAVNCLKEKGMLHFYHWAHEGDLYSGAIKLLKDMTKKLKRKIKIVNKKKVLPYGPRTWKIVIDAKFSV